MSERTSREVWEAIRASELVGSDVVPLPIETVKLLLTCARFVNEAAVHDLKVHSSYPHDVYKEYVFTDQQIRDHAEQLASRL